MRRITGRFVLLIATAAVLPLVIFGAVSVRSLRSGTRSSITAGNLRVATQVAEQVALYVRDNTRLMQSLAAELEGTELAQWQQDRILKDHVLTFPEFREVTFFGDDGQVLATSGIGQPRNRLPANAAGASAVSISPVTIDQDFLPTTTITVRVDGAARGRAWIVGELALEQLWRMVDSIHLNDRGFAAIVSEDVRLIAHGNPEKKRLIANADFATSGPQIDFVQRFRAGRSGPTTNYPDEGVDMLAVAAPVGETGWTVIVEQPTSEAYAITHRLEGQLFIAIALALLGTIIVGYAWARTFIQRIFALIRATRSIADGQLDARVAIPGRDEIHELGDAFNSMAHRLAVLQEDVRKQERQAMFGRIAAGLVHDLSNPIQNIGNSCRLILRMSDDEEYREVFRRTVDREMQIIRRALEDLRHVARPIPIERFPLDLHKMIGDVVQAMQQQAADAQVTLRADLGPQPQFIEGDLFQLGRVFSNLILNAIQATPPGGGVRVITESRDGRAQVRVADTGCGIPADRLQSIFEDFYTTKRHGLGLGLAISRKIVEQLDGTITVDSQVGQGTTFVMEFPLTEARPAVVVAG